jgi:hypothetical protein
MSGLQIVAALMLVGVALGFLALWQRSVAEHRALAARTAMAFEGLAEAVRDLSLKMGQSSIVAPPASAELPAVEPAGGEEDERTHVYARPTMVSVVQQRPPS